MKDKPIETDHWNLCVLHNGEYQCMAYDTRQRLLRDINNVRYIAGASIDSVIHGGRRVGKDTLNGLMISARTFGLNHLTGE